MSVFSSAAVRGAASQIEKETLKKRISKVEVMYSVYFNKMINILNFRHFRHFRQFRQLATKASALKLPRKRIEIY